MSIFEKGTKGARTTAVWNEKYGWVVRGKARDGKWVGISRGSRRRTQPRRSRPWALA